MLKYIAGAYLLIAASTAVIWLYECWDDETLGEPEQWGWALVAGLIWPGIVFLWIKDEFRKLG